MSGWAFGTTSDYARSAAPPVTGPPFTLMLAGQVSSLAGANTAMMICDPTVYGQHFRLSILTSGAGHFLANVTTSSAATTVNVTAVDTPFVLIGRARAIDDRDVILNGDLANKGTDVVSKTVVGANRLAFGKQDNTVNNNPFTGPIWYAAIWNVGLVDAECAALAKGAWPGLIRRSALVGFWPAFGRDGSTGTIRDQTGRAPLTVTAGALSALATRRYGPPPARRGFPMPATSAAVQLVG